MGRIAGLVTGALLKQAGHQVTVIEANGNRIGGRIKTFRAEPDQPAPFTDALQYAEAGAMRLPDSHPLTLALIDKLRLPRRLFYNVDIKPGTGNLRPRRTSDRSKRRGRIEEFCRRMTQSARPAGRGRPTLLSRSSGRSLTPGEIPIRDSDPRPLTEVVDHDQDSSQGHPHDAR